MNGFKPSIIRPDGSSSPSTVAILDKLWQMTVSEIDSCATNEKAER